MEDTVQDQQEFQQEDTMPLESTALLNSAAEAGSWDVVKELISNSDLSVEDIKQSFLLQKLATVSGLRHQIIEEILKKLFSSEARAQTLKNSAQTAIVAAANCENWDILMIFLMIPYTLLDDETNLLSVIEMVDKSQTLRSNWYMHIDVLSSVWWHSKQKILYSTDKRVPNTLVQLAAELNMWSRVCDLLVTKPDLNLLDRDGLSVLHRLILCPDSRFDSLLPVLLENGADFNLKTKKGETVLHIAAKYQKVEYVSECVQQVDTKDCESLTPKIASKYHIKCAKSKQQMVSKLIDMCHELDDCDSLGNTPVILAAENNNEGLLRLLLEHGARTDVVDEEQRSVLHVLALKGSSMVSDTYTTLISLCVNNGVQMNSPDINGLTALHLAVKSHNWTFMKSLVNFGADTGRPDDEGYNVLHRLAMTSAEQLDNVCQLFDLLHQRVCDLNAECRAGNTVLHLAAMTENLKLVKHLIRLVTSLDRCNRQGFTILHLLAMYKLRPPQDGQSSSDEVCENHRTELLSVIDILLDKGADLELLCSSGDTALHLAAKHKTWTVFTHLLQKGAKIQEDVTDKITLIERVAESSMAVNEQLYIFSYLLQHCALQNTRNLHGDTVLQVAAKHEQWMIVEHFLRHLGGNADEKDSEGFTILDRMAMSTGRVFKEGWCQSYVIYFIKRSRPRSNVELIRLTDMAARAGNVDILSQLIDSLEDVNMADGEGFTVLHRVAQFCVTKPAVVIQRLVEKGADVDKQCPHGDTALHLAAKNNNWLAVWHLLEHGASVSGVNNEGLSVLHRLVGHPHLRCKQCKQSPAAEKPLSLVAAILFKAKNDLVNQKDSQFNTPLHLAFKYGHWDMVTELLARGACLSERDSEGCTVLHILAKRDNSNYKETVKFRDNEIPNSEATKSEGRNSGDECVACCIDTERGVRFNFFFSILAKQNITHLDMCDIVVDHTKITDSCDNYGNTALILSAKYNNWDITERLVIKGANTRILDCNGLSVLHILASVKPESDNVFFCENMHKKLLELLVSSGADVSARDPEGNTPIQVAAKHGNMDMVERLLEFLDNVNETDSEGFTLLSRVGQSSSPRCEHIARQLVRKGADVNRTSSEGKSPLALSVIASNWPVTSVLLNVTSSNNSNTVLKEYHLNLHQLIEEECPLNVILHFYPNITVMQTRLNGKSVLQLAITKRRWDLVERFLAEGEFTDFEALTGSWAFHVLAECASHAYDIEFIILGLMPSDKHNINLRDDNGNTPLHILANSKSWMCIKPFVEHGADVNMPDSDGWTVLHKLAISSSRGDLSPFVDTLVECGADINMAGPENKTAVMLALEKRNWSVFWQLIQLGACYDWAEADQFLLLKKLYLFPKRNVQCEKLCGIINFLAHPGLNLSPGVPSVLQSQQSSENGFTSSESTEAKGQCGSHNLERLQSSFEKCVRCSNWTVANVILESGPDIDIKKPISGRPLIHVLVSLYEEDDHEAWLSFLTVLLRRGLDISSRDDGGRTVLMKHTVLSSFRELNTNPKALCRVLLEKGVNPSMVDDSGNSLLTKIMKLYKTSIFTIAKSLFEVGLLSCKTQFEGGESHTLFISKLIEAVLDVKPAVVKILFECGAISNCDMFLLSEEYSVVMSQLDEDFDDSEMDDLYQILQQAATQVQSLQSLCRIAVSCSLPLGVNRRDTVRDFPPHLKEYLLFNDEFSDLDRCSEIEEWDPKIVYFIDDIDDPFSDDDDDDDDDEHDDDNDDEHYDDDEQIFDIEDDYNWFF